MPAKGKPSNNPHGRPPDEKVKAIRDKIRENILDNIDEIFLNMNELAIKDRVDVWLRLIKDHLPPLSAEITEEAQERNIISVFEYINSKMENKKESTIKVLKRKTG